MIIDAEVHLISPAITKASSNFLDDREVFFKEKIYNHPDGQYALGLATVEKLIESMELCNIDKSLIMGLPFLNDNLNYEANKYIYSACRRYSDRFLGLGVLDPFNDVERHIQRFKNEFGFIGVKVIPSWQNFSLDSDDFYSVIEKIIKNNLILLPHINYLIQGSAQDGPQSLFNLIKKFPELKVLAPHLGGLICFHYLHKPVKKFFKNTRFITSVSETMKLIEYASEILDDDKLIFGTDYPFQPNHDQLNIVNKFEALNIKKTLKERIYSRNLIDFLNV